MVMYGCGTPCEGFVVAAVMQCGGASGGSYDWEVGLVDRALRVRQSMR